MNIRKTLLITAAIISMIGINSSLKATGGNGGSVIVISDGSCSSGGN